MTKRPPKPTADAGIAWWNSLTEEQRRAALRAADTAIVAEAWAHHCKIERWAVTAEKALRPKKSPRLTASACDR
jgi:hypothetical protein